MVRTFFGDDSNLSNDKLRSLAGDFSRRVTHWTKKNELPLISCMKGVRKSDVSAGYTEEADSNTGDGLHRKVKNV
ncbi:MAG: hypothetical protein PF904_00645 [Kiritimatiellae bacterium]|nr:hypothetical protein [Kiritimatiellia bacterium]